jgi:predicted RND superfamily exporter protein
LVAAALTLLLALVTFPTIRFSADRESLFRATEHELQQREDFQRRFGNWLDLIVVLDGGTEAERERCVIELGKTLSNDPLFEDVRATLELPGLEHQGLYFLSKDELASIDATLTQHSNVLAQMAKEGWYGFLEAGDSAAKGEQQERFSEAWRRSVEARGSAQLGELFPHFVVPSRAFFTDGANRHLIFFRSHDPLAAQRALAKLQTNLAYSGRVVMLGQLLLQAQEKEEMVRDAVLSTVLSICLVQLLLIHGFRETARPRLAFLSLIFGLLWSTAWAAMSVGVLNIITVNFLAITVGLGIDFSVHFLARYSEERSSQPSLDAMVATWNTTGFEILIGALATSLAFFALLLTDFQAVKELGLITGVAVMLCFLSVVLLLPPLTFWHESRRGFMPLSVVTLPWVSHGEMWLRRHPRRSVACGLVAMIVLGGFGTRVTFDYNLLNLQSDDFEAVIYERQSGFSTLAAYVVADNADQALLLKDRLEALPAVSLVKTVAELFPREPETKEELISSIVARAKALPAPAFDAEAEPDWRRLQSLTQGWDDRPGRPDWVVALSASGPGPVESVWKQMQGHLHGELDTMLGYLREHQTGLRLEEWKTRFPDLLRYSSSDGKTVLRVQGKKSLWERASLEEFTDQVQSVTDRALGPPFLIRNYLEQMRQSYYDAVRYAIVAILVLLFLYFRAGLPTFIALVPKVAGTLGMLGAMGICGINFNPANCMALPLTLGIGLVFGIHAVHRCLEHPDQLLVEGSTGKSISLAAWTDIASFGTMLVASNPGIFSIGFVMAVGVAANLAATYLLVPPLVVIFRDRLFRS